MRNRWPLRRLSARLVLVGCVLASSAASGQKSVALLPAYGDEGMSLDAQVRAAAEQLEGFELRGADRTAEDLAGAKALGLSCRPTDEACLGSLTVALGVDVLVVTSGRKRPDALVLTLSAYDAATGGRLSRVEEPLEPDGPARSAHVTELVGLLLVPERYLGTLVVQTGAPASTVVLDGGEPQPGPEARFLGVRAGQHTVVVQEEGRETTEVVAVVAGKTSTVTVALPSAVATASPAPGANAGVPGASSSGEVAEGTLSTMDDPGKTPVKDQGLAVLPLGVVAAGGGAALLGAVVSVAGGATALVMNSMIMAPLESADDAKRRERELQNATLRRPLGLAGLAVLGVGLAAMVAGVVTASAGAAWLGAESGALE